MEKKEVFIDFDGTITESHGFNSPVKNGAIESIKKLFVSGKFIIVIYSCRANSDICDPTDIDKMQKYLKIHDIPYHRIEYGKPHFHYIIDDRSYNPKSTPWEDIATILSMPE